MSKGRGKIVHYKLLNWYMLPDGYKSGKLGIAPTVLVAGVNHRQLLLNCIALYLYSEN